MGCIPRARYVLLCLAVSCFGEPDYEGRRCAADRRCPAGFTCLASGTCTSVAAQGCEEGSVETCYEGPPGTEGIAGCRGGTRTCTSGVFGPCEGQALPAASELCNGEDDDCDGDVDEGCPCMLGESRSCYPGPAGTAMVGLCRPGTQECIDGAFGSCTGAVVPAEELCDGLDQDCDGVPDDGDNPCGGVCPLAEAPGSGCDAIEDLDTCLDDVVACDSLNSTACREGGVDSDGDRYSAGPLACGGDCDDDDAARNLSDPASCTVVLEGSLSGLHEYPGLIVRIVNQLSVVPYDGQDLLGACDPGDSGCIEIRAAEIHVDGILSARGAGHGGGGGGGGGAPRCAVVGCTPLDTTGVMGPGGLGARDGVAGGGAPISSVHGGVGGRGGGDSGGPGGGRGTFFGCGGDSLDGLNGQPGGYGPGSPGINNDTTINRVTYLGGGGGGGGGGASSECRGMSGFAGGGGGGNPGGGYVRLVATERIVIGGRVDTRGLAAATGDGIPGTNPSDCVNGSLGDVIPGAGGSAAGPGTSSPSGHGGLACSETLPSDGGRGGAGAGGGVLLEAPGIELAGTVDLRGGGDITENGATLKIFTSTITGSAGSFFGRLCVGPLDGSCR